MSTKLNTTVNNCRRKNKEHTDKVRLTNEDLEEGNYPAKKRMRKEDGNLARNSEKRQGDIDWSNAKVVPRSEKSLWRNATGMKVLNNFAKVPWWTENRPKHHIIPLKYNVRI